MEDKIIKTLISTAISMTEKSYVPYSHFHVGAALLADDGTENGKIFTGCNIETQLTVQAIVQNALPFLRLLAKVIVILQPLLLSVA